MYAYLFVSLSVELRVGRMQTILCQNCPHYVNVLSGLACPGGYDCPTITSCEEPTLLCVV